MSVLADDVAAQVSTRLGINPSRISRRIRSAGLSCLGSGIVVIRGPNPGRKGQTQTQILEGPVACRKLMVAKVIVELESGGIAPIAAVSHRPPPEGMIVPVLELG